VQDVAATKTKTSKRNVSHFTRSMQTEAQRTVNELMRPPTGVQRTYVLELRIPPAASKF
jgi:hypothetical protein